MGRPVEEKRKTRWESIPAPEHAFLLDLHFVFDYLMADPQRFSVSQMVTIVEDMLAHWIDLD